MQKFPCSYKQKKACTVQIKLVSNITHVKKQTVKVRGFMHILREFDYIQDSQNYKKNEKYRCLDVFIFQKRRPTLKKNAFFFKFLKSFMVSFYKISQNQSSIPCCRQ